VSLDKCFRATVHVCAAATVSLSPSLPLTPGSLGPVCASLPPLNRCRGPGRKGVRAGGISQFDFRRGALIN